MSTLPDLPARRVPAFWLVQLAGWTAYGISTYLSFLPMVEPGRYLELGLIKGARTVLGFALSLVVREAARALGRGGPLSGGGMLALAALAVVLGPVWLGAYLAAGAQIRVEPVPIDWTSVPRSALDYSFVLLTWTALYLGASAWLEARERERQALAAEARIRDAELEVLRHQLNPHFLFNALNSIRALIPVTAGGARAMVNDFSELLRYTLGTSPRELAPLAREIDAVRTYLAVEQVRFDDRLEASVDVEPGLVDMPVPGFLLQPLVENAVKHGRSAGQRLEVRVTVRGTRDGLRIEVANTGSLQPPDPVQGSRSGMGIGLDNLSRRLHHAYGDRASLHLVDDGGWVRAVVELPVRVPVGA